jgi:hypothetical protein
MKTTLLELVQSILSDMDSEAVNSISDSVEAQQVASVIEDTYYNIISNRDIPELKRIITLTSLSDSTRPTHFKYPVNVKQLEEIRYNIASVGNVTYAVVPFIDPLEFIARQSTDEDATAIIQVPDVDTSAVFLIRNDGMPSYYTSFDDEHIVFNSYDAGVEAIMQASKTMAYGTVYPTFSITDAFEPHLDDNMMPYLLAESKSVCFSLFKSGSDPKVEQAARRLKSYVQNDMYRTKQANKRPHYGR